MFETPPAIVELGPESGWSLPARERGDPWRMRSRLCPISREGEIVVCGQRGESFGFGPLGPDPRPFVDEITGALTSRVGRNGTLGPGEVQGARSTGVGVGFRIRF